MLPWDDGFTIFLGRAAFAYSHQFRCQNREADGIEARVFYSGQSQFQASSGCMEANFVRTRRGPIRTLVLAAALLTSSPGAYAQLAADRTPTLEMLQTGLREMISRLKLTHLQHEQVERIIANAAIQLQLTRENSSLSVAGVLAQQQTIRIQTRR
jgi:hypothetical protein